MYQELSLLCLKYIVLQCLGGMSGRQHCICLHYSQNMQYTLLVNKAMIVSGINIYIYSLEIFPFHNIVLLTCLNQSPLAAPPPLIVYAPLVCSQSIDNKQGVDVTPRYNRLTIYSVNKHLIRIRLHSGK